MKRANKRENFQDFQNNQVFLNISQYSQENTCVGVAFKNSFFYRTPLVAASVYYIFRDKNSFLSEYPCKYQSCIYDSCKHLRWRALQIGYKPLTIIAIKLSILDVRNGPGYAFEYLYQIEIYFDINYWRPRYDQSFVGKFLISFHIF